MKIIIVGPGAMGTLFATKLYNKTREEIWLFDKDNKRAEIISRNGIKINGLINIKSKPDKVHITTDPLKIGKANLIIFFVKAFDTENAARKIIPCIGENTAILTLQNGLGNAEIIQKVIRSATLTMNPPGYPPRRVGVKGKGLNISLRDVTILAGTTSEGSTYNAPGFVTHTGCGETVLGYYSNTRPPQRGKLLKQIKDLFDSAGLRTSLTPNVKNQIWSKLILNSAINPLGAITLRKNGELLKDKCLKELLFSVVNESAEVARRCGMNLLYKDPVKKLEEVCKNTAGNYNSMLQDILKGKRTEIDYINGAIIRAAHSV
ncbi:MAG: 2-dehydropantoate 2-reductase, partial [Elusimicrobiota bacterium]